MRHTVTGMRYLTRTLSALAVLTFLLTASAAGAAGPAGPGSLRSRVAARGAGASLTNPYTYDNLPKGVRKVSLGTLYRDSAAGKVRSAVVDPTDGIVMFTLRSGQRDASLYVLEDASGLQNHLLSQGVDVSVGQITLVSPATNWWPVLSFFLTLGVPLGLIVFFMRRNRAKRAPTMAGGPTGSMGRTRSHHSEVMDTPATRFADVAGVEEAKAELAEFVEFLKNPAPFAAVGAKLPKGALLVGPPGTGKTMLARAVAGEAGVPFFAASGSDFAEIYVGMGPKRVRDLFAAAAKHPRAIVFIDEIDAVARKRGTSSVGGESERDNTLVALLNAMDGFRGSGTVVLAATNRPDTLDPAITRPGRLDRRVEVPNPDRLGRQRVLEVHAASRPLDDDVDLEEIARRTSGMSGADLAGVVNEAAIEAAREGATRIGARHFASAVATTAMGRARTSAVVTDADREVTAWHEAGHTVCAYVQTAADRPVSVSIVPRGPAGGVTWMSEGDDLFLKRSKASARLVVALGGRAAEELLLGEDFTQGAYGDLTSATQLATAMVTRYGMTGSGLAVRDPEVFGQAAADGVLERVDTILESALERARQILSSYRPFVEVLVAELLEHETLNAQAIDAAYARVRDQLPEHTPASVLASVRAGDPFAATTSDTSASVTPDTTPPSSANVAENANWHPLPWQRPRTARERLRAAVGAWRNGASQRSFDA